MKRGINIMKKIFVLIFCIFLLTGCSLFKSDVMEDIDVYTTTYPINYLIKYLYNDHSNVYSIYPSGVNFKDYELSDKKLNEFSKSDLFIFNSLDQDRNYAVKMINKNKDLLKLIAETLLEYETLTKEQIDYLVENGKMPEETEETSLEKMSITKLKELAKEKGIKNYSKMSKAELIEELGKLEK